MGAKAARRMLMKLTRGRATLKLCCDERFSHAFTACSCVFRLQSKRLIRQNNFGQR
jgi:hypothetical protein